MYIRERDIVCKGARAYTPKVMGQTVSTSAGCAPGDITDAIDKRRAYCANEHISNSLRNALDDGTLLLAPATSQSA